jgi:voltage-gated potassium channel
MATLIDHVIICGFGHVGKALAQELAQRQVQFVVIDHQPENLAAAEALGYLTYSGNAIDESVLLAAGIKQANVLATVLPSDASNVFITLTARELNAQLLIVSRGDLPETEKKLRLAGADHIVLLATISAQRMVNLITRPTTLDFFEQKVERSHLLELLMQLNLQIDELTIPHESPLIGLTLSILELRAKGAFIVIALRNTDGKLNTDPPSGRTLAVGDTAIVLGHQQDINYFVRQNVHKTELQYRGKRV